MQQLDVNSGFSGDRLFGFSRGRENSAVHKWSTIIMYRRQRWFGSVGMFNHNVLLLFYFALFDCRYFLALFFHQLSKPAAGLQAELF